MQATLAPGLRTSRPTAISTLCSERNRALPTVLRNNGDDTFLEIHPFNGVSGLQGFAWADLDADGDPDAALIDGSGKLHVFSNERQGQFRERSLACEFAAGASNQCRRRQQRRRSGSAAVQADGIIIRLSDKNEGQEWETTEVARTQQRSELSRKDHFACAWLTSTTTADLICCCLASGFAPPGENMLAALVWLER